MSTQEQKPVVAAEPAVVEPTPAPADVLAADKPSEAVEPKVEEPAKVESKAEGETALPVAEEKKEEKAEEPIYSGALGYKAPGLRK
jgi:predicted membrane-bound mannosyltransferase